MGATQVEAVVPSPKITLNHVMIYVLQDMVVRMRPQKMETLKTTHVPWYLERYFLFLKFKSFYLSF